MIRTTPIGSATMTTDLVSISFEDFKNAEETFLDGPILTYRYKTTSHMENLQARETSHFTCLYGTPKRTKKLATGTPIYVLELNVDTNRIEGIGYTQYNLLTDPPEIYRDARYVDWNRFVYGGEFHITREEFSSGFPELVEHLECKIFKGKGNQKRGIGFTRLSARTYNDAPFTEFTLVELIKRTFVNKYF